MKLGRVGGLYTSLQIAEYCFKHELPIWIGGMFETGIGRTLNLRFASFLQDAQAHDLSPSSRYFVEDILEEPIQMDGNGYIPLAGMNSEVAPSILQKYVLQTLKLS